MLKIILSLFSLLFFVHSAYAQVETNSSGRKSLQNLSPAELKLHQETVEVDGFALRISMLKQAFDEKNEGNIIAYQAYILRGIRRETDQLDLKITQEPAAETSLSAKIRLEKMKGIMDAIAEHSLNPADPDGAARDFVQYEDFLELMRQELAELKKQ